MIEPLNTYVVVKQEEEETKTSGGIYVPPAATNSVSILKVGEVMAINPNCKNIKVGDKVLYNKHAVANLPEDKCLRLVREEDLYGVVK